jgi:hypothetical protein
MPRCAHCRARQHSSTRLVRQPDTADRDVAMLMREQAAIKSGGEENSCSRLWYVGLEHGQPGGKLVRIEPFETMPRGFFESWRLLVFAR